MVVSWTIVAASAHRTIDPDGVAYLDIALQCLRGHWSALANSYWSPGYPLLLALWLRIFGQQPQREIFLLHSFAVVMLIASLASFEFFLNTMFRATRNPGADGGAERLPEWMIRAIGYAFFAWLTTFLLPASADHPDALVMSALLVAASFSIKICAGGGSMKDFALLGVVLGLGYLAKAAMFPLSFVVLAATLWCARKRPRAIAGLAAAFLLFALVSAPLVITLSRELGHPSFGNAAAINYAEAVNRINSIFWRGEPPGSGAPMHAFRQVNADPPVYEFATPVVGTYPLWEGHGYWCEGIEPQFRLRQQVSATHIALRAYFDIVFNQLGPLCLGFAILLLGAGDVRTYISRLLDYGVLLMPALAGLGMYALVRIETRFLPAFFLLLWAAAFFSLRMKSSVEARRYASIVAGAVIAIFTLQIAMETGHRASEFFGGAAVENWQAAQALHDLGIEPGARVAYMGDTLRDHVWAHLARATIVAEIPVSGSQDYWAEGAEQRRAALNSLAAAGAEVLVTRDTPGAATQQGWRRLGETGYFYLPLQAAIHRP